MRRRICAPGYFPPALFHNDREAYERFPRFGFGGTRLPLRRAFESPIAIACLRLLTLRPERPECAFPRLYSRISLPTSLLAEREYLRREPFLRPRFFRLELFLLLELLRRVVLFLRRVLFLRLRFAMHTSLFLQLPGRSRV